MNTLAVCKNTGQVPRPSTCLRFDGHYTSGLGSCLLTFASGTVNLLTEKESSRLNRTCSTLCYIACSINLATEGLTLHKANWEKICKG